MDMSRKIDVIKRDGSLEPFDVNKLAASIRRVSRYDEYHHAVGFAEGIRVHLLRKGILTVGTDDILEMVQKIMAERESHAMITMELHSRLRQEIRKDIFIKHENDTCVAWDKSWAAGLIHRTWDVSMSVSRIFAGEIEMELLENARSVFDRDELVRMMNEMVMAFGLADAVPVRQYEMEE